MKVIKATGLVPVKALVRFRQHGAGKVFGLEPALVGPAVIAREVELFPIPDDVETVELDIPLPNPDGEPDSSGDEGGEDDEIIIPDDWKSLQWMKQKLLAEKILGGPLPTVQDKNAAEVSREVIQTEVDRRAAEAKDNPAA